jgi:acyl transferase domain-containing protein
MKAGMEHEAADGAGMAVIGLAGRFPGARNVAEFWRNLRDGVESVHRFTDDELRAAGIPAEVLAHPNYVKARPRLADIDLFDAEFFGFNPREAEVLDPQQRLFLECVWEAIEEAGYAPEHCPGAISLFAGASASSYYAHHVLANPEAVSLVGSFQAFLSNIQDSLATRVAYKLNLRGACYSVQTFCSTSLVAVHLAAQALANLECDVAVAGGVSVQVPQEGGYWFQEGGILAPDGHCRAFDARAQGTLFGNGVGVVVLKRLEDAVADGDFIHAIIRGTATNNDGALKVSYTAPSVAGQAAVIVEALANAGVSPDQITYLEAHGTGTALGDPTEVAALTKAFRSGTRRNGYCALGSVKSNIGHLDAAAGVASLIKTILALRHREIPATLHFTAPHPEIDFARSPFYVCQQRTDWRPEAGPRLAGVSSFGIGGTNAHVIVQEAPVREPSGPSRPWQILPLSARTRAALDRATLDLAAHLREHLDQPLADVAYTLQLGRRSFSHRRVITCQSQAEALQALENSESSRCVTLHQERRNSPVVFMFPGQGAQHVQMGAALYQHEPVFREALDRCAAELQPHLGLDLRTVLYSPAENAASAASTLLQTAIAQPALFAVEYAQARLWQSWGIQPSAMIGHSLGEYVAACLAGVMPLADALRLVARRGALMQAQPPGAMMAVPLSADEVQAAVRTSGWEGALSLAAVNGPTLCVVSGESAVIDQFQAMLAAQGRDGRRLHTSHAFHSAMMDPVLAPFTECVRGVRLQPPTIPYLSNLTGTWIQAAQATDPAYWVNHLRHPVRFHDGIRTLTEDESRVLLEVGPGRTLATLARQASPGRAGILASGRAPQEEGSDLADAAGALGRLWLAGVEPDWPRYYSGQRRQRVPLPTYPFERKRFWIEPQKRAEAVKASRHGLVKRADVSQWFYLPAWKSAARPQSQPTMEQNACTWLVFADRTGLGAELIRRLNAAGHTVRRVTPGDAFSSAGPSAWVLRPGCPEDYGALATALRHAGRLPQRMVHLWSLDAPGAGEDGLRAAQDLGFYSLLHWVQAWNQAGLAEPVQLRVVTHQALEVTGDEELDPVQATTLAACRVIPQECHSIAVGSIDLHWSSAHRGLESCVDGLLEELTADAVEPVVAWRGRQRWLPAYEPIALQNPTVSPWQERGAYLITGGLGGVGMVLAECLARDARARLVLISRTSLPPREDQDAWLKDHAPTDPVSRRIERVRALEALGAEVLTVAADVADEGQMRVALAQARARFGQLHGVIHAAGELDKSTFLPVTQLGREACERQFLSKVTGLRVLERLLRDDPPAFCLLTSSLSAVLGGLGYCAYAAANAYMDAFARQQNRAAGTRWMSVNWDEWHLGAGTGEGQTAVARAAILPREGADAFRRLVSTRQLAQVIVSTSELEPRVNQWVRLASLRRDLETPDSTVSVHSRPNLSTAYTAPEGDMERTIAAIWQKLLGIGQVGRHDNFFELGGHSLLATQLLSRLRQAFEVDLPLPAIFDAPTPAELARRVQTVQSLTRPAPSAGEAEAGEREEIEI